jgi:hypothetical protein
MLENAGFGNVSGLGAALGRRAEQLLNDDLP